jgi:Skp family chaperone for outer membrane proteins
MGMTKEQILALAGEPVKKESRHHAAIRKVLTHFKIAQDGVLEADLIYAIIDNCGPLYTADQVLAARKSLEEEIERLQGYYDKEVARVTQFRQQLAEKDSEIERLRSEADPEALHIAYLHGQADRNQQLAAAQVREHQYREAVIQLAVQTTAEDREMIADKALSLPSDTSTLEAIVQKAGEVMRERCRESVHGNWQIGALPGVTLEDLK